LKIYSHFSQCTAGLALPLESNTSFFIQSYKFLSTATTTTTINQQIKLSFQLATRHTFWGLSSPRAPAVAVLSSRYYVPAALPCRFYFFFSSPQATPQIFLVTT
jgi:hypothetical protein